MHNDPQWQHTKIEFKGKSTMLGINFLSWTEADFQKMNGNPTFANLYTFMTQRVGNQDGLNYAVGRYKKIKNGRLIAIPAEANLNRICYLLKNALSDYIVKNPTGTIALCGMIAEIMTNFLFIIWNEKARLNPMSKKSQIHMFGEPFEQLGQKRKIGILREYGIITDATKSFFENIRKIRNDYVHPSKSLVLIDNDAEKIFQNTNKMLKHTIQFETINKKIFINKHVGEYILSKSIKENIPQNDI